MWAINLRIVGVVLGTLALYTLIANKIRRSSRRCRTR